jgi:7,8-dihydroneopterin aldolase/epimerase/oxygenase
MTTTTTPSPEPGSAPVPPTDTLRVTGIEVFAHHGVLEAERREGQTFRIDLALGLDVAAAAASDDLARTVDYGSLVTDVVSAVASDPVDLIETVAERVAGVCLARAGVLGVEVTVHKPEAPIEATFSDVALTINRRRA